MSNRAGDFKTVVAVDEGKNYFHFTLDGENVESCKADVDEFLSHLPEGCTIVIESSFLPLRPWQRNELIRKAKDRGFILLCSPPRKTPRVGVKLGFTVKGEYGLKFDKGDDAKAARAIWYIATDGKTHLHVPVEKTGDRPRFKEDPNLKYLRKSKQLKKTNPLVREILGSFPAYKSLPEIVKALFGDGKTYAIPVTVAVYQAAHHPEAVTRAGFERVIGAYEHGLPSYFRATVNRRFWDRTNKIDLTWSEARKALRWMYHTIRNADKVNSS